MKTTLFKTVFIFLLLITTGVGCKKQADPGEYKELTYLNVKGLNLTGDTCYIKESETKNFNLVINSHVDFEKYFGFKTDYTPQIDFTNYTLLAGSRIVNCCYPNLTQQDILINREIKAVRFTAQFIYDSGCYPAFGVIYFYALVPRLDDLYTVSFNVDIIKN